LGRPYPRRLVLDAGALIAIERHSREVRLMLQSALNNGGTIIVPATVVAQVWRDGARQARVAALLKSDDVTVEPLTPADARAAGVLCGLRNTSDIVDASVVISARRAGAIVVTSDPADLRRLDPSLTVAVI